MNDKLIQDTYDEFKRLFDDIELPQINIIYTTNTDYYGRFSGKDLHNKKYNLHIDTKLFNGNKLFIESTLFHEFTHLYDTVKFWCPNYKRFSSIFYYSEIHASFIAMQKLTGCFEDETIDYSCAVSVISYIVTLHELMYAHYDKIHNILENLSKIDQDVFTNTLTEMCYFIGEKLFSAIYVSDYNSIEFEINGILSEHINKIEQSFFREPHLINSEILKINKKYTENKKPNNS